MLGFRVHRMLKAEFLQAAQVTVYDYYEPCEQGPGNGGDPQGVQGLRRMGPEDKTEGRGARSQKTKWGAAGRVFFGSGRAGQKGAGRDLRRVVLRGMSFLGG